MGTVSIHFKTERKRRKFGTMSEKKEAKFQMSFLLANLRNLSDRKKYKRSLSYKGVGNESLAARNAQTR